MNSIETLLEYPLSFLNFVHNFRIFPYRQTFDVCWCGIFVNSVDPRPYDNCACKLRYNLWAHTHTHQQTQKKAEMRRHFVCLDCIREKQKRRAKTYTLTTSEYEIKHVHAMSIVFGFRVDCLITISTDWLQLIFIKISITHNDEQFIFSNKWHEHPIQWEFVHNHQKSIDFNLKYTVNRYLWSVLWVCC